MVKKYLFFHVTSWIDKYEVHMSKEIANIMATKEHYIISKNNKLNVYHLQQTIQYIRNVLMKKKDLHIDFIIQNVKKYYTGGNHESC